MRGLQLINSDDHKALQSTTCYFSIGKVMKNSIVSLIKDKDWDALIEQYSPNEVVSALPYKTGMILANTIFSYADRNDNIMNYAIDMLVSIRNNYPLEWSQDWKNDIYFGQLSQVVWRYQESYEALKRAYDKFTDPPAVVSYWLADCHNFPPEARIVSEKEAINLFKKSFEKEITEETAANLREIYKFRKDYTTSKYWDSVANEQN